MSKNGTIRTFDAILFDLGSTLLFFNGVWPEVIAESHRELVCDLVARGYRVDENRFAADFLARLNAYYVERDTEFIEHTTEYILRSLLEEYGYPEASSADLCPALERMYAISETHWQAEDDTHPTLRKLQEQGYRLGLISNANDSADLQKLIDLRNLRPYFETILVSAEVGIRKPHPRIFHLALSALDLPPERAVMVGDTLGADILGARNAGIASIWITRRASTPDNRDHLDTIRPDATIGALSELPEVLANWPDGHLHASNHTGGFSHP